MKRTTGWMRAAGVVVAVGVLLLYLLRPKPLEVETGIVETGPLRITINEEGRTRARDTFIVSAPTPFRRDDCRDLIADAPSVVARLFPEYRTLYERHGWPTIDVTRRSVEETAAAVLNQLHGGHGQVEVLG